MNDSPRWVCRIIRTCVGLGAEQPRSGVIGSGHVERCSDCRAWYAAQARLARALNLQATQHLPPVAPDLESRILSGIAISSSPAATHQPARRRLIGRGELDADHAATVVDRDRSTSRAVPFLLPILGAGAAAVLGFALIRHGPDRQGSDRAITVSAIPVMAETAAAEPSALGAMLQAQPLQSEAESVYADARGALQFLALNFLPAASTIAASPGGPPPPRIDG